MKYVIKWEGGEYVQVEKDEYFGTTSLETATKFDSIERAIVAIVKRTELTISTWRNPRNLTIVGIKEINQPRYEEVIL